MHKKLRRALFRYGWDTRCRNLIPARVLRPALKSWRAGRRPILLDVGSGNRGLSAFLPEFPVIGLDAEQPVETASNFSFTAGDATALPFGDDAFPLVSCVDVLEHMPPAIRATAINELVRVASQAVLIACPHGQCAHDADEKFLHDLQAHRREIPSWVTEHQQHPYPVPAEIARQVERAAKDLGLRASISITYCEPASACHLVRFWAARSDALYSAINFVLGAMLPILPTPGERNSYRMILLATLSPLSRQDADHTPGNHLVGESTGVSNGT